MIDKLCIVDQMFDKSPSTGQAHSALPDPSSQYIIQHLISPGNNSDPARLTSLYKTLLKDKYSPIIEE